MKKVVIALPKFALSGGNLVAYELGKYLSCNGVDVFFHSGFKIKRVDQVNLTKPKRGLLNSIWNILSFIFLSIYGLFYANVYIATHHLTAMFNFIRPCGFSLVQDIEINFYPDYLSFMGSFFWKNYLCSKKMIYTSKILADKIKPGDGGVVSGFPFVNTENISFVNIKKEYDCLMILRDGSYKNYNDTLELFYFLTKSNLNVLMINASRSIISEPNVVENISREHFLNLLVKSKCFICLSTWEGLGLPNLEAYSLGIDVISSSIPSAMLLYEHDSASISLNTDFNKIYELIVSKNNYVEVNLDVSARCDFLHNSNDKWMNYALQCIRNDKI